MGESTLQRHGFGLYAFQCNGQVTDSTFVWNSAHVGGELVLEQDTTYLCRNSCSRDGLPLTLPHETTGCTTTT